MMKGTISMELIVKKYENKKKPKIVEDPTKTKGLISDLDKFFKKLFNSLKSKLVKDMKTEYEKRFRGFQFDPNEEWIRLSIDEMLELEIKRATEQAFRRGYSRASGNIYKMRETQKIEVEPEPFLKPREKKEMQIINKSIIDKLIELTVNKIGTVTRDYLNTIEMIVTNGFLNGLETKEIAKQISTKTESSMFNAMRIARTETVRAANNGMMQKYLSEGITHWQWQTARERITIRKKKVFRKGKYIWVKSQGVCDLCLDLNGTTVQIGEPFGYSWKMGGQPIYKPPDPHPNCRCAVLPVMPSKKEKIKRGLKRIRKMLPFEEIE